MKKNILKKLIKLILGVCGAFIGYNLIFVLGMANDFSFSWSNIEIFFTTAQFAGIIGGAFIGFFLVPYLLESLLNFVSDFERNLKNMKWEKILITIFGLIIGLIFGALLNFAFSIRKIPRLGVPIQILINVVFTYMGFSVAIHNEKDLSDFIFNNNKKGLLDFGDLDELVSNKILDTSVIIDGRILDICKTGFIDGSLVIPEFILEELRHIADSSDVLKRNRGRRGLDILKKMQSENSIKVEIINQDFEEIPEVDSKLVKLAKIMDAEVITNDYNLNKVAELQGVKVLNINELANAVKPVVLPGEEMEVKIIKEGKEDEQGVGYLDDGTMIVVDDGIKYMGEKISVLVTSILQTAAGRMIFAKPKIQEQQAL
ncbi:MAG: PIN/TRAM domain-containing protein [Bacillota bacterium]